MASGKTIRDPLHGDILLTDMEVELLDSIPMQRLRRVRQNGLCFLVYPAMNSTRFEHSLGVMYLTGAMADYLDLTQKDLLKAAGLLHDIGHGPFSHTSDDIMSLFGRAHEENTSKLIFDSEISKILKKHGISPQDVSDLVMGKGKLSCILSSEIDSDKMDYLIRDSYYAGVAYGVIDVERIISCFKIVSNEVVVAEDGLSVIESLLISRNLMYQTVYRHHTKMIAECMLKNTLQLMASSDEFDFEQFVSWDDIDLITFLRNQEGYCGDIMKRIDERRLFKTVFRQKLTALGADFDGKTATKVKDEICSEMKIPPGYVLVDVPKLNLSEFKMKIECDGELRPIAEVSSLASALEKSELQNLTFGIYTSTEYADRFSKFDIDDYL